MVSARNRLAKLVILQFFLFITAIACAQNLTVTPHAGEDKVTPDSGIAEKVPASIDCAKATLNVEKMICADSVLSDLDNRLAQTYKKRVQANDKKDVQAQQRKWLAQVRNKCPDTSCLVTAYKTRIAVLQKSRQSKQYDFSGQWHVSLCDKNISEQCGGFTAYLVQDGEKICGDHYFATPGLGRLNEGSPRSVIGTVDDDAANLFVTSGRNGAVLRVRAVKKGETLDWKIVEDLKVGLEGESALVLNEGQLKRVGATAAYKAVADACKN